MHDQGDGSGRKQQRFKQRLEILRDSAFHPHLREHLVASRWKRRQWIHASLFTTIGIMVATIVPGFSTVIQVPAMEPLATLPLALPALPEGRPASHEMDNWQMIRIKSGQTLSSVFEDLQIPASVLHHLLQHPGTRPALTRLRPGVEIAFDLSAPGRLRALKFDRDADHQVVLRMAGDKIEEKVTVRESTTRTVVLSGTVGRSLTRSARQAGLTAANINSLTSDIFKYDIDFNSDLDADDHFSVLVDQTWREGELVSTSPVTAATFTVDGKLHSGFRYSRPGGKPEYFTTEGRPLKKSFIRMPIPYARLSSKFGARRHPVLGTMRMHKGVDYAASTGTPIMAAGDARVQFAGWQRGYGNVVILDHGRGHSTLYGHMSRMAKIRKGQRVGQGAVIGYVGSTGLATGPHLHYEFRINGVHRNPLSVTMPPPEPLSGAQLASFRTHTSNALARIRTVEDIIYATVSPAGDTVEVAATEPASKKG